MKNFHQNLLIALALGLCALCAYQWYDQTRQREQFNRLNQNSYNQSLAIQGYTNSINTMERQIAQMDARLTELKETIKTNDQNLLAQKRELNKAEAENRALTSEAAQYKQAVDSLKTKLTEAYDGIKKQNDVIKQLTAERDDFVQKYNESVKDRNAIVAKYNELADRFQKLQAGAKAPDK